MGGSSIELNAAEKSMHKTRSSQFPFQYYTNALHVPVMFP